MVTDSTSITSLNPLTQNQVSKRFVLHVLTPRVPVSLIIVRSLGSTHRHRSSHLPSSSAPHVSVTPHTGHLVNVNGGDIKIKGQKMVTYVTHRTVMNITFLIVDDIVNPIIGLDELHHDEV